MARTAREFLREVLERVAQRAESRARPQIPSATLRRALNTSIEDAVEGMVAKLQIPHYWAVYVHDGRSQITKSTGFLVFFRDISDDPRVSGGFPVRASEIRRLTRDQFRAGLEANRQHLANGGDPFTAPMIVVRQVGPTRGAEFFTKGMASFLEQEAAPLIAAEFDQYVQSLVDDGLHERATASLDLR